MSRLLCLSWWVDSTGIHPYRVFSGKKVVMEFVNDGWLMFFFVLGNLPGSFLNKRRFRG